MESNCRKIEQIEDQVTKYRQQWCIHFHRVSGIFTGRSIQHETTIPNHRQLFGCNASAHILKDEKRKMDKKKNEKMYIPWIWRDNEGLSIV